MTADGKINTIAFHNGAEDVILKEKLPDGTTVLLISEHFRKQRPKKFSSFLTVDPKPYTPPELKPTEKQHNY